MTYHLQLHGGPFDGAIVDWPATPIVLEVPVVYRPSATDAPVPIAAPAPWTAIYFRVIRELYVYIGAGDVRP